MKRGQEGSDVAWLIGLIALFLVIYVILLPEGEKEKLIQDPGNFGNDVIYSSGGGYGGQGSSAVPGTILLSETPGKLYAYGQSLFVKPFASVNLFSDVQQQEIPLTQATEVKSSFFSGDSKTYRFTVQNPQNVVKAQLLFLIQQGVGSIRIAVNDQEIFSGPLTTEELPLFIPPELLTKRNTLTFSVSAGVFGKNHYQLRDAALFVTDQQVHVREVRDFVLSQTQIQTLDYITLFYFVNCFTVQEQGTLTIRLNGNLLGQELIVCDAAEVSHDLPVSSLLPGRNILEFSVDGGKYVLEQMTVEGNAGQGRVPSYFFTLQQDEVRAGVPVTLDFKFLDNRERKVATVFINGFPLYLDTLTNGFFFDVTPYVTPGQNVIKIVPQTEMDIVDLTVFMG